MIEYGIEKHTTDLDDQGSTVTIIKKVRGYEVAQQYKQYHVRVKVRSSKEEMAEYMKHSEILKEKREAGKLVVIGDTALHPSFAIEYPKMDIDGTYFVIKSWTEYVSA